VKSTVNATSIDDVFRRHSLQEVLLVKIDTDGHEWTVMKGCQKALAKKAIRNFVSGLQKCCKCFISGLLLLQVLSQKCCVLRFVQPDVQLFLSHASRGTLSLSPVTRCGSTPFHGETEKTTPTSHRSIEASKHPHAALLVEATFGLAQAFFRFAEGLGAIM
jgi:hypothetical protein